MRLGFILLDNVCGVNNLKEVSELYITNSNAVRIYFRIVSFDHVGGKDQPILRYVPVTGASTVVKINHIDSTKVLNLSASQPFLADDRSIWAIDVPSSQIVGPDSLSVTLTEGAIVTVLKALSAIRSELVAGQNQYYC